MCRDGTADSAYTVLYEQNGNVYETIIGGSRSVQMLQSNGLFYGSGGASSGYVQGCELNEAIIFLVSLPIIVSRRFEGLSRG